jgi:hypothetical protein
MKRFFELTFKPFFVITGALTATVGIAAVAPRWTVETVQKIAFVPDYTIFVRHWGIMVGLAGLFMVAAAFHASWRTPVLIYSAIEKALFVTLCLAGARQPYAAGLLAPAAMDALVVLYVVAYFWSAGARREAPQAQRARMASPKELRSS